MSTNSLFQKYWREWETKLKGPVGRKASKLHFPLTLVEQKQGDGSVQFAPTEPVCFFNAPQKGSSHKRGKSHRMIIFIDGCFRLKADTQEIPALISGKCSISFFNYDIENSGDLCLDEIDAFHFDMESQGSPKPFHPIFHVQRDISNTLTDDIIREVIVKIERSTKAIKLINRMRPCSQHLRLPTPQMDMFSVFTMVIADFFCSGGDKDSKTRRQFDSILKHLVDTNNRARDGVAANVLHRRAGGGCLCPAHWYPEYDAPA